MFNIAYQDKAYQTIVLMHANLEIGLVLNQLTKSQHTLFIKINKMFCEFSPRYSPRLTDMPSSIDQIKVMLNAGNDITQKYPRNSSK